MGKTKSKYDKVNKNTKKNKQITKCKHLKKQSKKNIHKKHGGSGKCKQTGSRSRSRSRSRSGSGKGKQTGRRSRSGGSGSGSGNGSPNFSEFGSDDEEISRINLNDGVRDLPPYSFRPINEESSRPNAPFPGQLAQGLGAAEEAEAPTPGAGAAEETNLPFNSGNYVIISSNGDRFLQMLNGNPPITPPPSPPPPPTT